jgi:hypothetical protein
MVAELEKLIHKLAHREAEFTPRERELMELLRRNRDVILPQIEVMTTHYKGLNEAGKEKLKNLVAAIEKICGNE